MKICIVIDDYLPHSIKVGAKMVHELACELVKRGHFVSVITPSPNLKTDYSIEKLDGVVVYRFKSGKIKNIGRVRRAVNETLLPYLAWNALKDDIAKDRHDIVVYYSPTIFWGSLVTKLKRLWDAPSYLVLRDIFPQWAVDRGLIKKGSLIEKYFRYFERKNYEAADTIGLMSQKNLEWFKENVRSDARLEVLPNWAALTPASSDGTYRKKLGLENRVVFFYGGNIGQAQDMMNIVRLAKRMQKYPEAYFLLVGAGDEVELVKRAVTEEKIENLTLLPPVPQDEFKKMLSEFDIGLFTLHRDHSTHNFPGKLLGYMVQSMPILGSINIGNDLKETVEGAGAGFVTVNGEDDLFFDNARKLLDREKREEMGKKAFALLEKNFSVEAAANKILGKAVNR